MKTIENVVNKMLYCVLGRCNLGLISYSVGAIYVVLIVLHEVQQKLDYKNEEGKCFVSKMFYEISV